ncbi:MAG: PAS domain S-box protein [Syntrophaceae bacterium]|nr:PAS domain S-box protein [Syntrophaceae bacterium]
MPRLKPPRISFRAAAMIAEGRRGRSRVADSLKESEHLFRTLTEKSVAGIYVVQDGLFRFVNANAASYAGYSTEELIGKKSDFMVHPEDREAVKRNARAMLRGERASPHEFRILTKQGRTRWVLETVASITLDGRPAILGNSMDISEEKRTQEQLRESETWYRTLFETTGAATMILEEDTTISLVNREFVKRFGWTREETENRKSWTEFVVPEDVERMKQYHRLRRIDPAGPPKNYEFRFLHKSGEARNVFLTVDLIPGTRKSIASMVDITDLRKADEALRVRGSELENKTRELEELNAALRVLLKRREEDRNELEEKVLTNVKKLVLPYVEKLKKGRLDPVDRTSVLILESNLRDIIAPFSSKLTALHMNLTPRELQVAGLIREGRSTKEIAEFLNVTPSAVNICRHRIRHKLGLNNRKINLQTYLSQLP